MDALSKPRVVAIGGPTATGKTALSVELAKRFGGEIINADSMQVYRDLIIGTARATEAEQQGIPHHLLGFLSPEKPYSVADFTAAAVPLISDITARGKLPFLVGGTGLYITSLLNGVSFADENKDSQLRLQLQQQAEIQGDAAMYARLQAADPEYATKVHPHNISRVLRALEVMEVTGQTMTERQKAARSAEKPYRSLCLCITYRDRETLYKRIDRRVDAMVSNGIVEEACFVWENRTSFKTAAQAIGYKEYFPYFEGAKALNDCTNCLKQATRNYAKRQLTWFRNQNEAVWLYADEENIVDRATAELQRFLK